jgi:hypothetical protein
VFVFEERYIVEEYYLVHSNADGEIYSDDWNTIIREGLLEPHN